MDHDRRKRGNDRRRASRIEAVFGVKKTVGAHIHLCQAEELAPAGITLRRPREGVYPPRTPVALAFELPGTGQEISARGVVVHDEPSGARYRRTGIRFLTLRPEHQQLIAAYCRRVG